MPEGGSEMLSGFNVLFFAFIIGLFIGLLLD